VGIGFGLQEIVANFISGLIILFERPIRVGDAVTVGDTDGVVTKIKIRATTIRNWDCIIETAKANGHEPYRYLRHLFTELPKVSSPEHLAALLPFNVSPADIQHP